MFIVVSTPIVGHGHHMRCLRREAAVPRPHARDQSDASVGSVQVSLGDCRFLQMPRGQRMQVLKNILLESGVPVEEFMSQDQS